MIFFSDSPHFENWPNFQKQCSIFTSKSFRAVYFDDNIIYASKQFPLLMFGLFLTWTLNFYLLTSYGRIEIITMFRLIVEYYPKSHSKAILAIWSGALNFKNEQGDKCVPVIKHHRGWEEVRSLKKSPVRSLQFFRETLTNCHYIIILFMENTLAYL